VGVLGIVGALAAPALGWRLVTALDSAVMVSFIEKISFRRGSEGGVCLGGDVGSNPNILMVVGEERKDL
jgi:hypothetical protein